MTHGKKGGSELPHSEDQRYSCFVVSLRDMVPALLFAAALLAALSVGCKEKIGFGKKNTSSASAVPVVPQVKIVVEGVSMEEQSALKSLFRLNGMMHKGNEYVVVLNDQVVKTGQLLRFTVKREHYILKVLDITSQRIRLKATRKDENLAVPESATVPASITPP